MSKVLTMLICLLFTTGGGPVATEEFAPWKKNWQKRFTRASEAVKAGEYQKAKRIADKLLAEMEETLFGGKDVAQVLAKGLMLKALAQAGQGNGEDALWTWWEVQALDPAVAKFDLSSYGPPAETLLRIAAEDAAIAPDPEHKQLTLSDDTGFTPPRVLSQSLPDYPNALNRLCIQGKMLVEAIICADGSVRWPRVLQAPPVPVMTLAALKSLREWKFHPAQEDGQAVAVWYQLTITFKTLHCSTDG